MLQRMADLEGSRYVSPNGKVGIIVRQGLILTDVGFYPFNGSEKKKIPAITEDQLVDILRFGERYIRHALSSMRPGAGNLEDVPGGPEARIEYLS
jgi:hypothetical protein